MAETISSYTSKYSGDQLDAAIAALGGLEGVFASKADFDDFVENFTIKMNQFIAAANKSAQEAEKATDAVKDAKVALDSSKASLDDAVKNGYIRFEEI